MALKNKKIAVVIPAHNEKKMIEKVIQEIPSFVDKIIVVDDASTDGTINQINKCLKIYKNKLIVIKNKVNQGVGAAIVLGYKSALREKMDVTAVMAGDGQMNPAELKSICLPVIQNEADYVKGNRLVHGQAWAMMPKVRYLGNSVLSFLTKIASGYWYVADSQTGYTAISSGTLKNIWLENLYPRYGFPNDILVHLNIARARIKEVPITPVYFADGKSGIRIHKVIPTISWLLLRRFFWRMKKLYIIEDFHPLVFFYTFSIILLVFSLFLLIRLIIIWSSTGEIPAINALALMFCLVMLGQFLFFAMWLDMDYNKDLKVK